VDDGKREVLGVATQSLPVRIEKLLSLAAL
jgi:hypothetical protein